MTERQLAFGKLDGSGCSASHLESHFTDDPRLPRRRISPEQLALAAEKIQVSGTVNGGNTRSGSGFEVAATPSRSGPTTDSVIDTLRQRAERK